MQLRGGGGSTLTVSLTVKNPSFFHNFPWQSVTKILLCEAKPQNCRHKPTPCAKYRRPRLPQSSPQVLGDLLEKLLTMTLVSYFPKAECAKPFFWRPEFIRQFGAIFAPNDPCPLDAKRGNTFIYERWKSLVKARCRRRHLGILSYFWRWADSRPSEFC